MKIIFNAYKHREIMPNIVANIVNPAKRETLYRISNNKSDMVCLYMYHIPR